MTENKLKVLIIDRGYTIRKLSEEIGVNEQTITNWCNNRNIDNIKKFSDLCRVLNIHPNEIFPIKKKD